MNITSKLLLSIFICITLPTACSEEKKEPTKTQSSTRPSTPWFTMQQQPASCVDDEQFDCRPTKIQPSVGRSTAQSPFPQTFRPITVQFASPSRLITPEPPHSNHSLDKSDDLSDELFEEDTKSQELNNVLLKAQQEAAQQISHIQALSQLTQDLLQLKKELQPLAAYIALSRQKTTKDQSTQTDPAADSSK